MLAVHMTGKYLIIMTDTIVVKLNVRSFFDKKISINTCLSSKRSDI